MVADALAKQFGSRFKDDARSGSLKAKLRYKGKDFILCKPSSYMNLSGGPVLKLMHANKLVPKEVLVVCDDVSLGLGRIKAKARGGSGGHNGLDSIIRALGSKDFPRLRIGISAPFVRKDISDYVLSRFSKAEEARLLQALERAKEALLCWLENGIEITMNRFNQMKPRLTERME
jgi:PTH1 family peptidyl-tRNA hydrolase